VKPLINLSYKPNSINIKGEKKSALQKQKLSIYTTYWGIYLSQSKFMEQ
jgi:hypothetical protein